MTALLLRRSLSLKEMRAQLVLQRIPSVLQSKRSCEKRSPLLLVCGSCPNQRKYDSDYTGRVRSIYFVPPNAVVITHSGARFFHVKLKNDELTVGWDRVAFAHNLGRNYILMFGLVGHLQFDLFVFDEEECEISYAWSTTLPIHQVNAPIGWDAELVMSNANAYKGGDWNTSGTCHLETMPDLASLPVLSQMSVHLYIVLEVLSKCLNKSKAKKLDLLNVTYLTSRRKDGHSSLYYLGLGIGPPPIDRQDCSLWCLPAVPDSWKELLYAFFLEGEYS